MPHHHIKSITTIIHTIYPSPLSRPLLSLYLLCSNLPSSGQQIQKSGLPTARWPHNAHHVPGVEVDGDVLQNLLCDSLLASTGVVHGLTVRGDQHRLDTEEIVIIKLARYGWVVMKMGKYLLQVNQINQFK